MLPQPPAGSPEFVAVAGSSEAALDGALRRLELEGGFRVQRDKISPGADNSSIWALIKFVIKKEWQLP